jgi:hypothetical protein
MVKIIVPPVRGPVEDKTIKAVKGFKVTPDPSLGEKEVRIYGLCLNF